MIKFAKNLCPKKWAKMGKKWAEPKKFPINVIIGYPFMDKKVVSAQKSGLCGQKSGQKWAEKFSDFLAKMGKNS